MQAHTSPLRSVAPFLKLMFTFQSNAGNFFRLCNQPPLIRLSVSVNRQQIIMRTMWTSTKNYVNRCKPAWKFMRTGVNHKHTLVSVALKICEPVWTDIKYYVNWCEPAQEIMWTGVNRGSHQPKVCPLSVAIFAIWLARRYKGNKSTANKNK